MKVQVLKRRPEVKTDRIREKRISTEILVDAYDASERAMGWYYYLDQQLQFPFLARCISSPDFTFGNQRRSHSDGDGA
jgi:hypothetical protein